MWQSMETAPKTDENFILYFPNLRVSGPYIICYQEVNKWGRWYISCTGEVPDGTPIKWCRIPAGAESE